MSRPALLEDPFILTDADDFSIFGVRSWLPERDLASFPCTKYRKKNTLAPIIPRSPMDCDSLAPAMLASTRVSGQLDAKIRFRCSTRSVGARMHEISAAVRLRAGLLGAHRELQFTHADSCVDCRTGPTERDSSAEEDAMDRPALSKQSAGCIAVACSSDALAANSQATSEEWSIRALWLAVG